ncbi:MAG: hypothetical protein ACI9UT_000333, partial [Flavobacteriales bacterium]
MFYYCSALTFILLLASIILITHGVFKTIIGIG